MIVTIDDLTASELFPEIVDKITRNNDSTVEMAILEAESLVKSYMGKYDTDAIFGTDEIEPTYTKGDVPIIKKMIKVIAAYYLIRKANPSVQIELFKDDHDKALEWLEKLQSGAVNPTLPYKPDDPATEENESNTGVSWSSNLKRTNAF